MTVCLIVQSDVSLLWEFSVICLFLSRKSFEDVFVDLLFDASEQIIAE